MTPDEETYDEEDAAFCLEMLLRIVLENRWERAIFKQTYPELVLKPKAILLSGFWEQETHEALGTRGELVLDCVGHNSSEL